MDEWWKNYDNPISDGAWWSRVAAPDDATTLDRDPEGVAAMTLPEGKEKDRYKLTPLIPVMPSNAVSC